MQSVTPTPQEIKSRHFIQNLIEEGEHVHQDFKYQISDARKIAKSISAFANNDGGHLLIGVKDNGKIAGVQSDEEIYMIEQAASMYCKPEQTAHFSVYRIEGKSVVKVDIDKAASRPVLAQDDNHRWRAYYRVADENIIADSLQVKVWHNAKRHDGAVIELTEAEHILIDYIKSNGSITLNEFMTVAHISHRSAETAVINLCSMKALSIVYQDGAFVIAAAD